VALGNAPDPVLQVITRAARMKTGINARQLCSLNIGKSAVNFSKDSRIMRTSGLENS